MTTTQTSAQSSTQTGLRTDMTLRRAMRGDALCSVGAGVALVAAAQPFSTFAGMPTTVAYALGAGSVLCGLSFFALSRLPRVRAAGAGVATANAAGTVIAAVVALTAAPPLTPAGVVTVLGAGVYTAVCAVLQYRGVRRVTA